MFSSTFLTLFGVLGYMVYGVPLQPSSLNPFIIGGENAPQAYSPHMAALIFGERLQVLVCGGSIISRRLVLTAAHCIEPLILDNGNLIASIRIRVGSNKWNSGGIIVMIQSFYIHPQWDSHYIKYDAAVLVLKKKLELNNNLAIIRLCWDYVDGTERSFVTGWGRTGPKFEDDVVHLAPTPDDLQLLYVSTMNHEQCQLQMTSVAGDIAPPIQREIEICTFHSYGHGMCTGDSGSALVKSSGNCQIGIVSWGFNCASGAPDVFTRITGIKDFLKPIMNTHKD